MSEEGSHDDGEGIIRWRVRCIYCGKVAPQEIMLPVRTSADVRNLKLEIDLEGVPFIRGKNRGETHHDEKVHAGRALSRCSACRVESVVRLRFKGRAVTGIGYEFVDPEAFSAALLRKRPKTRAQRSPATRK